MKQLGIPCVAGKLPGEMIIDLFAGGGGASHGIEKALGRSPDIAVNHDPASIAMHAENHPATTHLCESIYDVDPRAVTRGQPVGLMWASPSCTHFSRARGATPVSRQERGLGWQIVKWAALTRPRVIVAENVAEWETWGPVRRGRPVRRLAGKYFQQLIDHLRSLGYAVEWRVLNAADHGAPTTRKRLFLVARCDGEPIYWPHPTYGPSRKTPHRSAAECINWDDLGSSIFDRKKPLAPATCRRIAAGLYRYVLREKPFFAPKQPQRQTCGVADRADLVASFMAEHCSGDLSGHITCRNALSHPNPSGPLNNLVASSLVTLRGTQPNHLHGDSIRSPLRTISAGGCHHALFSAFLTIYYSGGGTASPLNVPLPTVVTKARHGLVVAAIDGYTYAITDIFLRMLQPAELALAQGFPRDYVLTGTKAQQIGRIGNSVSPPIAEAIISAQFASRRALSSVA